jgi:hypothetical protein
MVDINDSQAGLAMIVESEVLEMYLEKTGEKIHVDRLVIMIGVDISCCDRSIEEDAEIWPPHDTGIWIHQTKVSEVDNIVYKLDGHWSRYSAFSIM